jgi:repressor LexA
MMHAGMILTKRQKELLDFLESHIRRRGYAPTLEEIGHRFGLGSVATVHKHLTNLEQKGAIRRKSNLSRAIELVPLRRQARAKELPLLGRVAAGEPIEAIEVPDAIAVPEELSAGPAGYVLQVQGDSMIDEGIFEGDYIVVDGRRTANNGDTVVAVIDGAATVKKFYRERGRIRLQPANARLQPIFVRGAGIELRGVVVGLMRRYPRR